ncbi:lantibiotic dehydratase [Streptomyces pseudovenezuelae]|uniref:Thiopeptide-type bacteriocin biosynthesis protein n=1 Tax=Streptomyces pseudovenezuelae TaxID=67350 RepID=A0ABT6LYX5_9ACTN|nr:lantibiotic dehydratase [Streptomyces pseudovenezuelae]MDH6221499.1 thiopeptide-type bacteriocin biosynthesis protein [Streptomyces pseudovenezuelae]
MASRAVVDYQWQGAAMLRATTSPGPADIPRTLDLDDVTVTRGWLNRIWQREEFRSALKLATPVLSDAIETVVRGRQAEPRHVRRTALSTVSYLLRWQHRPTPLGLFAGTAPVSVGSRASVRWRDKPRATIRPDAEWVTEMILRLQRSPELLKRLPLVANNAARARGDRLVAPGPPSDGHALLLAPVEISVRNARPVAAAMDAARIPVPYGDLHTRLHDRFPQATPEKIDALLLSLVEQQFLISSLWAPMTTVDAFQHLCRELDRHQADSVPDVRDLVHALYAVREDVSSPQPTLQDTSVLARMRALSPVTPTPLLIDTALDCEIEIPQAVIAEAQAAVSALYRTTPQPYGYQHWRDYHRRFRARYGVGALVPVMDLVSDSGLGLPAGYVGSERGAAPKLLTDRDELLLALVQQVLLDGRDELRLTDATVDALERAAGSDERLFVPRVEVAFEVHAPSTTALAQGSFDVQLTSVPRPGSSMAGRFAHVLPPEQQEGLGATYLGAPDVLSTQLVFPPRRRRNENVIRTPQLLPNIIELSGHREVDETTIQLCDIAVTADSRSFHLVQLSTDRRIDVRVLHALEGGTQTPPLARFLAEVATARYAAYKPFDFGAGARLPFLPRVRYRRTILTQARWLLMADDLPGRKAPTRQWDDAFDAWRGRLRVPDQAAMIEYDQRLPLDLTHPAHRRALRAHLDSTRRLELREVPDGDAHGWIGRAHEIWLSLGRPQPETGDTPQPRPATPGATRRHLPGAGDVLHAQLHAHPRRYDEILSQYLPRLLAAFGDTQPTWWFTRHRETARPDADQHLDFTLHLPQGAYGSAAGHVHTWADTLHGLGLASGLVLTTYQPQTGRFGHGAAMDAAHQVFAADSAAALAQLQLAESSDAFAPQALAAASSLNLVTQLTATTAEAEEWLVDNLPQGNGKLDRTLRNQMLELATSEGESALAALPGGCQVAEAWWARAVVLDVYRKILAPERDPLTVARSLLHQHHVRALGVSPSIEATTLRLVRNAALQHRMTNR